MLLHYCGCFHTAEEGTDMSVQARDPSDRLEWSTMALSRAEQNRVKQFRMEWSEVEIGWVLQQEFHIEPKFKLWSLFEFATQ